MKVEDYKELLEKEIHKEYRKSSIEEIKDVENTQKNIEDRVFDVSDKLGSLFNPEMAQLNIKSEIFSACPHKKSALLFKIKRGRKRKCPGN